MPGEKGQGAPLVALSREAVRLRASMSVKRSALVKTFIATIPLSGDLVERLHP